MNAQLLAVMDKLFTKEPILLPDKWWKCLCIAARNFGRGNGVERLVQFVSMCYDPPKSIRLSILKACKAQKDDVGWLTIDVIYKALASLNDGFPSKGYVVQHYAECVDGWRIEPVYITTDLDHAHTLRNRLWGEFQKANATSANRVFVTKIADLSLDELIDTVALYEGGHYTGQD